MRTALTIAGSDSGAGAGIQADLKTFAAHGVYGTCAITAVTAQNTRRVSMVTALAPDLVTAQIEAVATDIGVDAAKTGMLANGAIVRAVAAAVRSRALRPLVVDPVMIAKSGDALLEPDAIDALRSELLPLAYVVTPNIPEAEALAGIRIESMDHCREAARRIAALGPAHVVIKGGHARTEDITDVLFDGRDFDVFRTDRVPGRHTHGTGCTFSASLTAHLAFGRGVREAIPLAQEYLAGAIRAGLALGAGHGPMDHFWRSGK
jgi:hydroxymethylpyrimidine/phosphomethylpyrimidine kinase